MNSADAVMWEHNNTWAKTAKTAKDTLLKVLEIGGLSDVVVLGYSYNEAQPIVMTSNMSKADAIFILEQAKHLILKGETDE